MCSFCPIPRVHVGVRILSGLALLAIAITASGQPATVPASNPATRPARPEAEEIRQAIRQLSHPVHARRRAAIRQFAEWGPVAFPELRRVIRSGDHEAALSARDLLKELQQAILIGAQIRLELDRTRAAWNEPVTLIVHAHNSSGDPIVVPWPATEPPATQPSVEDARQVGAMLDAADFLIVTGPDGQPIDPRVDPIERDTLVYEAVNRRARGTPPSHPMPAGASDDLRIPLFNRGWARYAMLAAGRYTVTFAYQPEWEDASWTSDGFGLVRSEPVTLEIIEAAPEAIRTAATPLVLRIRPEASSYVAELESTWDREMFVNLNFGELDEMHAVLEWRIVAAQAAPDDEPVRWTPEQPDAGFRPERIIGLKPGARAVISRTPAAALAAKARVLAKAAQGPVEVSVRYMHLPNPPQIREALAEQGRSAEVPRELFSGTVSSESIAIDPK